MKIVYITYRNLSKDDLAVMSLLDKAHVRRLYIGARMYGFSVMDKVSTLVENRSVY